MKYLNRVVSWIVDRLSGLPMFNSKRARTCHVRYRTFCDKVGSIRKKIDNSKLITVNASEPFAIQLIRAAMRCTLTLGLLPLLLLSLFLELPTRKQVELMLKIIFFIVLLYAIHKYLYKHNVYKYLSDEWDKIVEFHNQEKEIRRASQERYEGYIRRKKERERKIREEKERRESDPFYYRKEVLANPDKFPKVYAEYGEQYRKEIEEAEKQQNKDKEKDKAK